MKSTTQLIVAVLYFSALGNTRAAFLKKFVHLICGSSSHSEPAEHWILQKLDHFNDSETRTWQMRYLANNQYFKNGGPIFIFLGGEEAVSENYLRCGHFHDMARNHNGYLFYTEHRYYGKSTPVADLSTPNLKYLNANQALADVAYFIRTIKGTIPGLANSKVIVAGGSYAGSLVVWLKRSYPALIDGGWASSAQLLAKLDFSEASKRVGTAIQTLGSKECFSLIWMGIAHLEIMFATGRAAEVKTLLNICDNFDGNNELDRRSLFESIFMIFAGFVQYNPAGEIPIVCSAVTAVMQGKDYAAGIAALISPKLTDCWDVSYIFTNSEKFRSWDRSWYYQKCNELGGFMSSGSMNHGFGTMFPLSYLINQCADLFGNEYTESYIEQKIAQTNFLFGGLETKVENIYMTHGEFDIWNQLGVHNDTTIITGASHCSDFSSINSLDSEEMRASKERIAELVNEWVTI